MPWKNEDLHGNAPDKSRVALLLIDVINDLEFPEGDQLLEHALPMADRVADLAARAAAVEVPVIYVNDNFGRWQSNFHAQIEHCLEGRTSGAGRWSPSSGPTSEDYFVLKPKHSASSRRRSTSCSITSASRPLILAGIAGNICVLFTANDAYMRDFNLVIPADCVASNTGGEPRGPRCDGQGPQGRRLPFGRGRPGGPQTGRRPVEESDGALGPVLKERGRARRPAPRSGNQLPAAEVAAVGGAGAGVGVVEPAGMVSVGLRGSFWSRLAVW